MNQQGHVALVTGGSSGIGLAIVRALLAHGWKVAICGRDGKKLERATDLAGDEPERAARLSASIADVSNVEDVRRWVSEACGHFGPPSIIISNAGVGAWGEITELEEADWDRADADVPAEKMILPDDIAATVLYLLNLSPNVAIREIVMERTTSL